MVNSTAIINCFWRKYTNFTDFLRKHSAVSLKDIVLELHFAVTQRPAGYVGCADSDHVRLVNLGPSFLFIKYRLTSSSENEIKETENAHKKCLI